MPGKEEERDTDYHTYIDPINDEKRLKLVTDSRMKHVRVFWVSGGNRTSFLPDLLFPWGKEIILRDG